MIIEEISSDHASKINEIKIHFSHFDADDDGFILAMFNVEYDGSIFGHCNVRLKSLINYYNANFHDLEFRDAKWKDGKRRHPDFMQDLYDAVEIKIEALLPIWQEKNRNKRKIECIKRSSKPGLALLGWNLNQGFNKEMAKDPEKQYPKSRLVREVVKKAKKR